MGYSYYPLSSGLGAPAGEPGVPNEIGDQDCGDFADLDYGLALWPARQTRITDVLGAERLTQSPHQPIGHSHKPTALSRFPRVREADLKGRRGRFDLFVEPSGNVRCLGIWDV
jgi:hypothetical protein